jgi:hypothetical protein
MRLIKMAIWGVKFQTADSRQELVNYMKKYYSLREMANAILCPYKSTNGRTKWVLLDSDSKRFNKELVCYDPVNEEYRMVHYPMDVQGGRVCRICGKSVSD